MQYFPPPGGSGSYSPPIPISDVQNLQSTLTAQGNVMTQNTIAIVNLQDISTSATATTALGRNQVNTLFMDGATVGNPATGGTFTLTDGVTESDPIDPTGDITNDVFSALQDIYGVGNVAVLMVDDVTFANGGIMTISFIEDLARTAVDISIGDSSITSGGDPVTATTVAYFTFVVPDTNVDAKFIKDIENNIIVDVSGIKTVINRVAAYNENGIVRAYVNTDASGTINLQTADILGNPLVQFNMSTSQFSGGWQVNEGFDLIPVLDTEGMDDPFDNIKPLTTRFFDYTFTNYPAGGFTGLADRANLGTVYGVVPIAAQNQLLGCILTWNPGGNLTVSRPEANIITGEITLTELSNDSEFLNGQIVRLMVVGTPNTTTDVQTDLPD